MAGSVGRSHEGKGLFSSGLIGVEQPKDRGTLWVSLPVIRPEWRPKAMYVQIGDMERRKAWGGLWAGQTQPGPELAVGGRSR